MIGLKRYDDTLAPEERPGLSRGWYEGTLHHMIDGGWFWVIRFDNVPGSESNITSVGLTLDMRKYPQRDDITPEQEFYEIVDAVPEHRQAPRGRRGGAPLGRHGPAAVLGHGQRGPPLLPHVRTPTASSTPSTRAA